MESIYRGYGYRLFMESVYIYIGEMGGICALLLHEKTRDKYCGNAVKYCVPHV